MIAGVPVAVWYGSRASLLEPAPTPHFCSACSAADDIDSRQPCHTPLCSTDSQGAVLATWGGSASLPRHLDLILVSAPNTGRGEDCRLRAVALAGHHAAQAPTSRVLPKREPGFRPRRRNNSGLDAMQSVVCVGATHHTGCRRFSSNACRTHRNRVSFTAGRR